MVVARRGPNLAKRAFGHQVISHDSVPEAVADSTGVGSAVENSADHLRLAGPGVTVFPYVAVKAQGAVILSFSKPLLLQEMNWQNCRVTAVTAAEGKRSILQICDVRNRATGGRDDLGHPAEIGVAHGDRSTGVTAPLIGLQIG